MSNKATSWARDVRGINPGPKLVLLLLADCHNAHTDECFPSQDKLAEESGFTVRSVQRHIEALEADGLISRDTEALGRGKGSRTHYSLHLTIMQAKSLRVQSLHPTISTVAPDKIDTLDTTPVSSPLKDEPEIEPEVTGRDGARELAPLTPPDPPKRKPTPRGKARGSRLSSNWTPCAEALAFARTQNMTPQEIRHEAEKFRDYWIGVPGQRGVKLDWLATWRNWVRRGCEQRQPAVPNGGPPRGADAFEAVRRDLEGYPAERAGEAGLFDDGGQGDIIDAEKVDGVWAA